MLWIFLTIGGSLAAGLANVFDKLLLRKKHLSDPWTFTFWSGIFGLLALVLIPFGSVSAPFEAAFIAFLAGILFLIGVFFFFRALAKSQASIALPVIGGLTPFATYGFSILLLGSALGLGDLIGFVLIVGSAILFFGIERREMRMQNMISAYLSAFFFGMSNVLKKAAFNDTTFLAGFIWISAGSGALALASLMLPKVRKNIQLALRHSDVKNKTLYLNNRLLALLGTVSISGAIAFGHPALVEAGQGFKYVVIFFGAWLMLREEFSGAVLARKLIAIVLMAFGFLWLGLTAYAGNIPVDMDRPITWGVTFSERFSRRIGLDPKQNLDAILNDLRPSTIRLVAYWDEIEQTQGKYNFSSLDWQLTRAARTNTRVILAVGVRVPRWPECFMPPWVSALSPEKREEAIRSYVAVVVNHYQNHAEIATWQVENEVFLPFGFCPQRKSADFDKEIALVRSLDPSRPVLITDSGEFGDWYRAAKRGDIFGTSLYRRIYSPTLGMFIGEIHYPLAPSFFRLKEKIIRFLLNDYAKRFVVIELQAEPWGRVEIPLLPVNEQVSLFTPDYFRETIDYAKQTGFDEYYLWGAEWWYLMGMKYNNWAYWEEAKEVMRGR